MEVVTLRVTSAFGGRAEAASDGGRIHVNDHRAADWEGGSTLPSNHGGIVWDLWLDAGETRTMREGSGVQLQPEKEVDRQTDL